MLCPREAAGGSDLTRYVVKAREGLGSVRAPRGEVNPPCLACPERTAADPTVGAITGGPGYRALASGGRIEGRMRVCVVRRDDPGRDVQGRCRGACSGSSLAAINWAIAREATSAGALAEQSQSLSARSRVPVGAGSPESGSRQDTTTGSRGTLGVLPSRPVQCARRERRSSGRAQKRRPKASSFVAAARPSRRRRSQRPQE
ncbi:hypothetical protein IscW_ISCW003675 [Ixodes scapularis]|uniref:Uncharacterized protein n=1 Tax=Ixodes scapularis TaxID=6945 RepID=B7PF05_IXOSC|nr:hypothetical protein IscW_ISCW003675 [Ixodes scapularis]|eukprot:XP_002433777.1 hypothetical protein IscW_ISCW003675 [Ixodes scapularis]